MERRELFQRVAAAATAAGVVGRVSTVAAEPRPALCLVELSGLDDEASERTVRNLHELLQDNDALAGVQVIGLIDGIRLTFLDANGRVCNQAIEDTADPKSRFDFPKVTFRPGKTTCR